MKIAGTGGHRIKSETWCGKAVAAGGASSLHAQSQKRLAPGNREFAQDAFDVGIDGVFRQKQLFRH
jgi:hypothetical protein